MRNDKQTRIRMNPDNASWGDEEPQGYWFESELTQVSVSQLHCTLHNAG